MAELVQRRAKHVVAAGTAEHMAGICLVQFSKTGLQVHFPYHSFDTTAVSRCETAPGATVQIDLGPGGGYSSFPPKYAHHVDGRCHLSQDGKILTTIVNDAHPLLTGHRGHLFTIDAQGLGAFNPPPPRRHYGTAEFEFDVMPSAVHFAFFWGKVGLGGVPPVDELTNPVALRRRRSGLPDLPCLAIAGDRDEPLEDYVLLIHARPREPFLAETEVALSLLGGFGADLAEPAKASSLLVMRAPASDISAELPNIDLANVVEV